MVTFMAAPKNDLAIPPFNDIVMTDVTITYDLGQSGDRDAAVRRRPGQRHDSGPGFELQSSRRSPSDAINNRHSGDRRGDGIAAIDVPRRSRSRERQITFRSCDNWWSRSAPDPETDDRIGSPLRPPAAATSSGGASSFRTGSRRAMEILTLTHARIRAGQGDLSGAPAFCGRSWSDCRTTPRRGPCSKSSHEKAEREAVPERAEPLSEP